MKHTLVVLDHRTFLVPTRHLPPQPWEVGQFLEWEVHPEEAKAWQIARIEADLRKLDTLGEAFSHLLAGGSPTAIEVPVDPVAGREAFAKALAGLKRRGGGDAVRKAWDGPDGERLARAVDKAIAESEADES